MSERGRATTGRTARADHDARAAAAPSGGAPTQHDLDEFDGEWVVLRGNAVIDHDPDLDTLRARAEPLARGDALVPIGHPPGGYQVFG